MITSFVFFTANSLKCYKCESNTSFDDCESNKTIQDCSSSADERCVKFNYHFSKTANGSRQWETKFGLGCVSQPRCSSSQFPSCRTLAEDGKKDDNIKMTCDVRCCGHDFCNADVKSNASFLLLAITSLVSFMLAFF